MEESVSRRLVAGLAKGMAYVTALTDESMNILWVSPSVHDLTGWSADELIGRNAIEFVHPDDLEGVLRLVVAETESPTPYGVDPARRSTNRIRFLDAHGGWCSLDIAANNQIDNPDVSGMVFILSDSTEQRHLDAVYDSMVAGSPLHVTAERVVELLSWQTDGARVTARLDGDQEVGAGRSVAGRVELEIAVETGGTLSIEHDADGSPTAWFVVLAERAAALLKLASTRQLGEQTLRRRLDEKTAIISAVSHDLRSPIAAIHLMSSLLDGNGDALSDEQRRELARRISVDARRTSRLLADLTSVDRLLHGPAELRLQRVSLEALVDRLLTEVDAPDHEIVRGAGAGREADVFAHADPVLSERILDNLVANAITHTPVGSRVQISFEPVDEHHVVLHVDDDGQGLRDDESEFIFDAYARGEHSMQRPGSGMGLFLVRTFAEVQGGRATCGTSPMGGARFSVVLSRWVS